MPRPAWTAYLAFSSLAGEQREERKLQQNPPVFPLLREWQGERVFLILCPLLLVPRTWNSKITQALKVALKKSSCSGFQKPS